MFVFVPGKAPAEELIQLTDMDDTGVYQDTVDLNTYENPWRHNSAAVVAWHIGLRKIRGTGACELWLKDVSAYEHKITTNGFLSTYGNVGILGRYNKDTQDGYLVTVANGTDGIRLYKRVSGAYTQIAAGTYPGTWPADGYPLLWLHCADSVQTVRQGSEAGTLICSATDDHMDGEVGTAGWRTSYPAGYTFDIPSSGSYFRLDGKLTGSSPAGLIRSVRRA